MSLINLRYLIIAFSLNSLGLVSCLIEPNIDRYLFVLSHIQRLANYWHQENRTCVINQYTITSYEESKFNTRNIGYLSYFPHLYVLRADYAHMTSSSPTPSQTTISETILSYLSSKFVLLNEYNIYRLY